MNTRTYKRRARIRKKIKNVTSLPRLSVFRSNKYMYAQIIDDTKNTTIVGILDKTIKGEMNKSQRAKRLGADIAKRAIDKKIKKVVFDKGSYSYHGRVKEIADGAREGGLIF